MNVNWTTEAAPTNVPTLLAASSVNVLTLNLVWQETDALVKVKTTEYEGRKKNESQAP